MVKRRTKRMRIEKVKEVEEGGGEREEEEEALEGTSQNMCVLSQFLNVSHFIWLPSSERKILDRPEKRGARVINWKKKKDEKLFFFFFLNLVDYTTRYMIWPGGGDWLPTVSILCPVGTSPLLLFPRVPVARIRTTQTVTKSARFFSKSCICIWRGLLLLLLLLLLDLTMADSSNPSPAVQAATPSSSSSTVTWRKISLPLPHLFPHLTINLRGHLPPARPSSPPSTGVGGSSGASVTKVKSGRDWKLRRQKTYDSPGCLNASATHGAPPISGKPPPHRPASVANDSTANVPASKVINILQYSIYTSVRQFPRNVEHIRNIFPEPTKEK